jgi:hypothetical protein
MMISSGWGIVKSALSPAGMLPYNRLPDIGRYTEPRANRARRSLLLFGPAKPIYNVAADRIPLR